MRRCTTARLHRFVVVLLVIVVLIVSLVVIRRVADRDRVVVIAVAGTGRDAVARDSGHEPIGMRCRQSHCGGMRSFCPG
jgi:hypothetical protein